MRPVRFAYEGWAAHGPGNSDPPGGVSRPRSRADRRSPPLKDEGQHGANALALKVHIITGRLDCTDGTRPAQVDGERVATLRARLALQGYALHRLPDGPLLICRSVRSLVPGDLCAVESVAGGIGAIA